VAVAAPVEEVVAAEAAEEEAAEEAAVAADAASAGLLWSSRLQWRVRMCRLMSLASGQWRLSTPSP